MTRFIADRVNYPRNCFKNLTNVVKKKDCVFFKTKGT